MNAESRLFQGGGYTVAVPSIDLAEVGAGGGSIAWIDSGGALKVGPQSAGAEPGPACYGLGGELPTVTDAFAVLGFLGEEGIAGGRQSIDVELARNAIESVASPLGLTAEMAAWGIHQLNTATMIRAVRAVTTERGRDPRRMEILTFGGAGPVQAAEVLRQLGAQRVVVPPLPGVFSSFGLLLADLSFDFQRSLMRSSSNLGDDDLAREFAELRDDAAAQLAAMNVDLADLDAQWGLDMRYEGQSSELQVHVAEGAGVAETVEAFAREHEETYGHRSDGELVDVVTIRFRARRIGGQASYAELVKLIGQRRVSLGTSSPQSRTAFFEGSGYETSILYREDLGPTKMEGPLIVREYDSTVVVPPGMSARLDGLDDIIIEPISEGGNVGLAE
jgi:N-methylhydantoinase A